MQAQAHQYAMDYRSATTAHAVLVLVSLPLLLIRSTVRAACWLT